MGPAMLFREFQRISPNRDLLPRHEGLGVLFHHSGLGFGETLARMLLPESKVSYHCLIDEDGARCTLVPDEHIAWHAGASNFLGRSRCNDFLLGVAFAGDTYREPLTDPQIASALEWLDGRWESRQWSPERMTDHRQVSPDRKKDLNPREWERLREAISVHFASRPGAEVPSPKS